MILVEHNKTLWGPNEYADVPIIVVSIKVSDTDLSLIPQKIETITTFSNRWFKFNSYCGQISLEAFLLSFLAEWVKAALNEVAGNLLYSGFVADEDGNLLMIEFYQPKFSLHAIELAAHLVSNPMNLDEQEFLKLMDRFWKLCTNIHPDFQIQFLLDYARSINLPAFRFIENTIFWQFGYGSKSKVFFESAPIDDSAIGRSISSNKNLTKQVLHSLGLPVVDHILVDNIDELSDEAESLGYPLVVKPMDRGRSVGVSVNIMDYSKLKFGFDMARKESRNKIIIEKYIPGDVYRIIVIRGKLWKVIKREVPFVIGDGKTSIFDLFKQKNNLIERTLRPGAIVGKVPYDDDLEETLTKQNRSIDSVPSKGDKIRLRSIPLLSSGAQYFDVTDRINSETIRACELISKTFSIASLGIDFITEDISKSCYESGSFLEINTTPGLNVPFMAGVDRIEIGKQIVGQNCTDLPLLFILTDKLHYQNLYKSFDKPNWLGWIIGSDSGVGPNLRKFKHKNIYFALKDVAKNQNVSKLILITDIETIEEVGLPFQRATLSILMNDQLKFSPFFKVIDRHSLEIRYANSVEDISNIFESFISS